jgi:hypothetical protein
MMQFIAGIAAAAVVLAVGQLAFGVEPTLGEAIVVSVACTAIRFVNDVFFEA